MVKNSKTILICPLNWGIGHASRCVPLIRLLLMHRQQVVIAADGKPLAFLRQQFPTLPYEEFKSKIPSYSKGKKQVMKLLFQLPAFWIGYLYDRKKIEELVKKTKADAVISDNRFGAFSRYKPSVYITHQLHIQLPKKLRHFRRVLSFVHLQIIKNYTVCWIADIPTFANLSGALSRPLPKNIPCEPIGILSRFNSQKHSVSRKENKLLILLSGPEPQRSILERRLLFQLEDLDVQTTILRGLPGETDLPIAPAHIQLMNHLEDEVFANLVLTSGHIIARAGYSTIMDLIALGRSAMLIPTPGQPEQEYLSAYLADSGWFETCPQETVDIRKLLQQSIVPQTEFPKPPFLIEATILRWLEGI